MGESYVDGLVELPIGTLVVDLMRQYIGGGDFLAKDVL